MKWWWALVFLGGSVSSLFAQPQPTVRLRVEVEPRQITIGDPIRYRIVVTFSNTLAPAPLGLPDPLGEFELLDFLSLTPAATPQGEKTQEHNLLLTTFSTGSLVIPALSLNFSTQSGEQAEANTQEVTIQVESLLEKFGDEGNLRPLKGFFNFRSYAWIWILLSVLLVATLLYFVVRAGRARNKEASTSQAPSRPPEEVIWETINQIEDADWVNPEHSKEFYSELSFGVRRYLEGRYQLSALDRTTAELLSEFRKNQLPSSATSLLKVFFENGDLVKFAKVSAPTDQMERDLDAIKQFVALTTPPSEHPKKTKRKKFRYEMGQPRLFVASDSFCPWRPGIFFFFGCKISRGFFFLLRNE